jgi:hypothetical protein
MMLKKLVLAVVFLNLSGCMPPSSPVVTALLEYSKATAVQTTYAMRTSEHHTSMLTDKSPKNSSECIGNAFRSYNDDGDYTYGDTRVVQLKGENYSVVSKRPYNPKLVSYLGDHNIDQILFLTEVKEGAAGKNQIDIWYNPDAVFGSGKIELAKTIVAPCG